VLVHGDLWVGNAGVLSDGRGCLFDPAVSYSDREVDLAMAQLFGGVPLALFDAYEKQWPLPAGHRQRRDIYNLFHLLNHANLYGGAYQLQCSLVIEELLAQD
jgi:fructosamine-3-kinase